MSNDPVHYNEYLQLDALLKAQLPESARHGVEAHDEMLFIITHQTYELWFRQILHEIDSVRAIMTKPSVNDNSPDLQTVVHRLHRVSTILKLLVHQIDVLETMTAMDFLEFRDLLRPASGFQSWQFKILEAKLGLKFENRHGLEHYLSQLRDTEVSLIRTAEAEESLLTLVLRWLERTPFFEERDLWRDYIPAHPVDQEVETGHIFWNDYRGIYIHGLSQAESSNQKYFDEVFVHGTVIPVKAARAALFIMLYRGYPILQLPFQLLNNLLEIDEQLSTWRYRHMNMVHRMIGTRIGTGGSSGRDYLKGALEKHYIFSMFASLTSFLIDRTKLPQLTHQMEARLGFGLSNSAVNK
jgi:tryptophan 2,3-dioxygenase